MCYPEFIEKCMFELTSGQYVSCLSDEDNNKDLISKTLLLVDVILDYCNTFYNKNSSRPISNWYSNTKISDLLNIVLPYMYIKDYTDKEIADLIFQIFKKINQRFSLENFAYIVNIIEGSTYKRFLKLANICDELIDLIYENYNENTIKEEIVPLLSTIDGLLEVNNIGIPISSSNNSSDYENNSSVVVSMIIGLITNMDKKSFKFIANFNNEEIPFKEKNTTDIKDEIIYNLF